MLEEEINIVDVVKPDTDVAVYIAENIGFFTRVAYKACCKAHGSKNVNLDCAQELVSDVMLRFVEKSNGLEVALYKDGDINTINSQICCFIGECAKSKKYSNSGYIKFSKRNEYKVYREPTTEELRIINESETISDYERGKSINMYEAVADSINYMDMVEKTVDFDSAVQICLEKFSSKDRKLEFWQWLKGIAASSEIAGHNLERVLINGYEDLIRDSEFLEELSDIIKCIETGMVKDVQYI